MQVAIHSKTGQELQPVAVIRQTLMCLENDSEVVGKDLTSAMPETRVL